MEDGVDSPTWSPLAWFPPWTWGLSPQTPGLSVHRCPSSVLQLLSRGKSPETPPPLLSNVAEKRGSWHHRPDRWTCRLSPPSLTLLSLVSVPLHTFPQSPNYPSLAARQLIILKRCELHLRSCNFRPDVLPSAAARAHLHLSARLTAHSQVQQTVDLTGQKTFYLYITMNRERKTCVIYVLIYSAEQLFQENSPRNERLLTNCLKMNIYPSTKLQSCFHQMS